MELERLGNLLCEVKKKGDLLFILKKSCLLPRESMPPKRKRSCL